MAQNRKDLKPRPPIHEAGLPLTSVIFLFLDSPFSSFLSKVFTALESFTNILPAHFPHVVPSSWHSQPFHASMCLTTSPRLGEWLALLCSGDIHPEGFSTLSGTGKHVLLLRYSPEGLDLSLDLTQSRCSMSACLGDLGPGYNVASEGHI